MSHDCNKFIINNGKFVRDFETMYQLFNDPWDQKKMNEQDLAVNAAFHFLHELIQFHGQRIRNVLDVGCADGYYEEKLLLSVGGENITGTDISPTVIERARTKSDNGKISFLVDDIRVKKAAWESCYDLIFSSKTIYYVAPEIDQVIENIKYYLGSGGIFCFVYNQTANAFSNQWLTYETLRLKLIRAGFSEILFWEMNRFSEEATAVGIFKK